MPTPFTPLPALAGGILIGLAALVLYAALGRIAGISGILNAALEQRDGRAWRAAFLLGLVAAASACLAWSGAAARSGFPLPWLVAAGVLVGVGTRLGNGCTSGHGVCGLSRLSLRSLIAVLAFMAGGMAATFLLRHVLGVLP